MVALPETSDQSPVPTEGVAAASEAVAAQTVCEGPALAGEGFASRVTVTVAVDAGHTPFTTDHTN